MSTEQQLHATKQTINQPEQRETTYAAVKSDDQIKVRYHDETETPEYQRAVGERIKEGVKRAEDPESHKGYGEKMKEGLQSAGETVQTYAELAKDKALIAKDRVASSMAPETQTPAQQILAPQKPVTQKVKEGLQSTGETIQTYAGLAKDKVVSAMAPETQTSHEELKSQKPVTQKVREGLQSAGETAQTYAGIAKDKVASAIAPSHTELTPESEKGIGQKMREGLQNAGQAAKDKLVESSSSGSSFGSSSGSSYGSTYGSSSEIQSAEITVPSDSEVVVLVLSPEQKELQSTNSTVQSGPGIGQQMKEGLQSTKESIKEKLTPESQKGYGQIVKEQIQSGLQTASEYAGSGLQTASTYAGIAKEKVASMVASDSKEGVQDTSLTSESQKGYGQKMKEGLQSAGETAQQYAAIAKDKAAVVKDKALSTLTPAPQDSHTNTQEVLPSTGMSQPVFIPVQVPIPMVVAQTGAMLPQTGMVQQVPVMQQIPVQAPIQAPVQIGGVHDSSIGTKTSGDERRL